MNASPLKLIVMISGNGSNLQAIIDAIAAKQLNATIECVISSSEKAYGVQRAVQAGIAYEIVSSKNCRDRQEYTHNLLATLCRYSVELIVLAGFMQILSAEFVKKFEGRIVNIHPSLLPAYPGLNTHRRVLENGDREHGTTIHFVTSELDAGPIVVQRSTPIFIGENETLLKARIQKIEHELYPQTLQKIASHKNLLSDTDALLAVLKKNTIIN